MYSRSKGLHLALRTLTAIPFFLFIAFCAMGQLDQNYSPIPVFDTIPPHLERVLKERLKEDQKGVQESGRVGAYIRTIQEQRTEAIIRTINADLLILEGELPVYLNRILDDIYSANRNLPRKTTVFPFRSEMTNAVSFGEGTLAIMLGLLSRLETEDQIAFVLCHELAHYHAGHSAENLRQIARQNFDKDIKRRISAITSSQYDRYTRLKQLYKELDLEITKHSRNREMEADSLALIYYLNTRYSRLAPLRCMQVLDQADRSMFTKVLDLKKTFYFPDYPFKDKWASYQKSNTWHASREMNDTTGTHPDCESRFHALRRQLRTDTSGVIDLNAGSKPNSWQTASLFELINSHYHLEQYGKSLFLALNLLERHPSNTWLHAMIGRNLYRLYEAQKEHRLASALELPDPRFDENYDRFLTFIHALRLNELAGLTYHYMISQPENDFHDEEFLYSLWLASTLDNSEIDSEEVLKDYQSRFPSGKFLRDMKKPKPKY